MSPAGTNSLHERVRRALAADDELAKLVVKELADKDELFERLEEAVSEKLELADQLAAAQVAAESLEKRVAIMDATRREPPPAAPSTQPPAGGDGQARQEIDRLRQARRELEEELTVRDDIISQLKDDFQKARHGSSDVSSIVAEKNNLAEQLTLAMSQLEELSNRDKTKQRLDQLSQLVEDLQARLEGKTADAERLRGRLAELEKSKEPASRRGSGRSPDESGDGASPPHGSPVLIWIAGALLGTTIWFGFQAYGVRPRAPASATAVAAAAEAPLAVLEAVVRLRLLHQDASLGRVLDRASSIVKRKAPELREALDKAALSEIPYRRALGLLGLGSFTEGLAALQRAEGDLARQEALFRYFEGRAAFFVGKTADADRLLRLSIERDATLGDPWRALGDVNNQAERAQEALQCYGQAVLLDPSDAAAYTAMGTIYSLQDEPDKALEQLQKAVAADRELPAAQYALGLLYQRKEDWGRAAEAFDEVLALEPDHPQAHFYVGRCYEILGRKDKAAYHQGRARALGFAGGRATPSASPAPATTAATAGEAP